MTLRTTSRLIAFSCLLSLSPVWAQKPAVDPFEDAMRETIFFYREGKLNEAKASLQKAIEVPDHKQSETVAGTLPEAPTGWTAGETTKENLPFGGGRVVRRTYKADGGKELLMEAMKLLREIDRRKLKEME